MKRTLIATLVGAIIIFIYQSLSWTVLPIHKSAFKYSAVQDTILAVLSSNIIEDGIYYMPNMPPGTPHEEVEKAMNERLGKPGALVSYYSAMSYDMGKNIAVGMLLNILTVWFIVYILTKASGVFSTFGSRVWITLLIYLVVALQAHFMEWNWIQLPMHFKGGEILDCILSGIVLGSWFGWYLGRVPKVA